MLAALTAAVALHTDRFAVLEGRPPLYRVHTSGRATTPVDVELLLAVADSGDALTGGGWRCLPIDDDCRLVVDDPAVADALAPFVTAARLAGQVPARCAVGAAAGAEVESLRSVATRILRARELDEALLAVTNETLGLLNSDIAGVMLREGDEIVMRACAGNQLADTGNLRMRRGQGLAGHVFATGQAAKVDDYLRSDVISNDFNYLARAEKTRSALGAPLVVDGEVIGVLEVWRRRESTFTPGDIRRLVALADLAAIALDNARQHEISQASQHAVSSPTRPAGPARQGGARARRSAGADRGVDRGRATAGIVRIVGERSGCEVVLLDADLDLLAGPAAVPELDAIRRAIRRALQRPRARHRRHDVDRAGSATGMAIRAVRTGTEEIGWVCLLTTAKAGDESIELAATQAALTFALQHLEQQAAAKARASMREDLLLNLLKGSADERRGAVARAKYLQIDLRGPLRIAVCTFAGLDSFAQAAGWSSPNLDQVRRRLFHQCEGALTEVGLLRLAAANGNGMIALIHSADGAELRAALDGVVDGLRAGLPHCQPIWGVSGPHTNPQQLDRAHTEAATALQALRQDSGRTGGVLRGPWRARAADRRPAGPAAEQVRGRHHRTDPGARRAGTAPAWSRPCAPTST